MTLATVNGYAVVLGIIGVSFATCAVFLLVDLRRWRRTQRRRDEMRDRRIADKYTAPRGTR